MFPGAALSRGVEQAASGPRAQEQSGLDLRREPLVLVSESRRLLSAWVEAPFAAGVAAKVEPVVVGAPVVMPAEREGVLEISGSTVDPLPRMVDLAPGESMATGHSAGDVP